jgi:hypothetical protein
MLVPQAPQVHDAASLVEESHWSWTLCSDLCQLSHAMTLMVIKGFPDLYPYQTLVVRCETYFSWHSQACLSKAVLEVCWEVLQEYGNRLTYY